MSQKQRYGTKLHMGGQDMIQWEHRKTKELEYLRSISLPGERWATVENFEDYSVSTEGRVVSFKRKEPKLLKIGHYLSRNGAASINLYSNNVEEVVLVARLVLNTFGDTESTESLLVGYRDGDSDNVRFDNLFWTSRKESENCKAGVGKLQARSRKRIRCVNTGEEYNSLTEAARNTGVGMKSISAQLRDRNQTAGGLRFEYIDDAESAKVERKPRQKGCKYIPIEGEELRDIEGFDGYKVSNLGRVVSYHRDSPKVLGIGTGMSVYLTKDNKRYSRSVAILVLKAFKPIGRDDISPKYKDGDTSNVKLDNLDWDYGKIRVGMSRRKMVRNVETQEVYGSLKDAAHAIGYSLGTLSAIVDNPRKTAFGHHWESVTGEEAIKILEEKGWN